MSSEFGGDLANLSAIKVHLSSSQQSLQQNSQLCFEVCILIDNGMSMSSVIETM